MDDSTEMKLLLPKLEMRGSVPAINLVGTSLCIVWSLSHEIPGIEVPSLMSSTSDICTVE